MQLSDAIQQYLADRKVKGFKASTLRGEKHVLDLLLADVGNLQTQHLAVRHLDLYWSKRTTWSPGTSNKARDTLSTFFQWLQVRGHMKKDVNLLDGTTKLRVTPRPRILIPQAEFDTFLDGIESARSRAMCAIGLYLFTRISETRALRWQDIDLYENKAGVFRPKTQTLDLLPICEELQEELRRWRLAYSTAIGRQVMPADYVIPFAKAGRYSGVPGAKSKLVLIEEPKFLPHQSAQLSGALTRTLRNAGYYQPYEGGHTLRRSGAVALYHSLADRGHDKAMRTVQWMLGHKSISTTEIYLRLDLEQKSAHALLAGKRMFPKAEAAQVVELRSAE